MLSNPMLSNVVQSPIQSYPMSNVTWSPTMTPPWFGRTTFRPATAVRRTLEHRTISPDERAYVQRVWSRVYARHARLVVASSVESERVFSLGCRILTEQRPNLNQDQVYKLLQARNTLFSNLILLEKLWNEQQKKERDKDSAEQ